MKYLYSNDNELISILGRHVKHLDFKSVMVRALFGILYQKIAGRHISESTAFKIILNYEYTNQLTEFEKNEIYKIDAHQPASTSQENNANVLLDFLAVYKEFTLANYENWGIINSQLFADMYAKPVDLGWGYEQSGNFDGRNQQYSIVSKANTSSKAKLKFIFKILLCVVVIITTAVAFKEQISVAVIITAIIIINGIKGYKDR